MSVFLFALAGIPPLGRLGGQVRRVPGAAVRRDRLRRRAGRGRGRELGDRALLLRQRGPPDVVPGRARGRDHVHPGAVLAHRRPRHRRPRHAGLRRLPRPGHPLRRRRQPRRHLGPVRSGPDSSSGRIRDSEVMERGALRARRASTSGRGRRRAARRLPDRPRGRPALRRRGGPGAGRLVGASRAGRTASPCTTSAPGRARWAAAWRWPAAPTATWPSTARRPNGPATRASSRRPSCPTARSSAWSSPTSCWTTCRST